MFKVWCKATGENTFATNSVIHDTAEDAHEAGRDLFMRWFALEEFAVLPVKPEFVGFLEPQVVNDNKVEVS